MNRARILVADDHRMLREAFARLLEPQFEIVGQAGDGRTALRMALALKPDVVVLDICMPHLNGLDCMRQIHRDQPQTRVIVLTVSEDPELAAESFRAGAAGFLLKNSAAEELFKAVQEALQGNCYVTPIATHALLDAVKNKRTDAQAPSRPTASPRQREVLQLLAEGHTMKEIAVILSITPRTVAFHKYSLMKELGIKSSAELVRYGVKQRVVID